MRKKEFKMKKFLFGLSILLFSNIVFAETLPISVNKTETHGRKHKELPEIPSDKEANFIYLSDDYKIEIPVGKEVDGIEFSKEGKSFRLKRISKDKKCLAYDGKVVVIKEDERIQSYPCIEWEKSYYNGKLTNYVSYEIIPIPKDLKVIGPQNISFDEYYQRKFKHAVWWFHTNGKVFGIRDTTSSQQFDEQGNLTADCDHLNCCEQYDEKTQKWIHAGCMARE